MVGGPPRPKPPIPLSCPDLPHFFPPPEPPFPPKPNGTGYLRVIFMLNLDRLPCLLSIKFSLNDSGVLVRNANEVSKSFHSLLLVNDLSFPYQGHNICALGQCIAFLPNPNAPLLSAMLFEVVLRDCLQPLLIPVSFGSV